MNLLDILLGPIVGGTINNVLDYFKDTSAGKFKQTETSYYDSVAINMTPTLAKEFLDKSYRLGSEVEGSGSRRSYPLSYEDGPKFGHRSDMDMDSVKIGDVLLTVPSQFISISNNTPNNTLVTLRQSDNLNIGRGYSNKSVTISIFFNGESQINGYKTKWGDMEYCMDGLRSLMAQFKVAPFVPISNSLINNAGVFNVAMSNMLINTVEGFPNCFEVTLSMIEINMTPFIEAPTYLFHDMIDWDLFRYNYQRLLNKDKAKHYFPTYTSKDANKLVIKQIKSEALSGYKRGDSIYEEDNFVTVIDSSDNFFVVQNVNFQVTNIISTAQLSDQSTPTAQYIGGMGYTFNVILETTSLNTITSFTILQETVQRYMKSYKEFGTFGFISVENAAINLTGTKYISIDRITITNVEGFPDLYRIDLAMSSFNVGQHDKESIEGIKPFEGRDGTSDDAIMQSAVGVINTIKQDTVIENRLREMELYPDLDLPKVSDIDAFITTNNSIRASLGLQQMPITKYPREIVMDRNIFVENESIFVEPDFYVFYPLPYSSMSSDMFTEGGNVEVNDGEESPETRTYQATEVGYVAPKFRSPSKIKNVTTVGRSVEWGDSPQSNLVYDENNNLIGINGTSSAGGGASGGHVPGATNNDLANILLEAEAEGCGYILGSNGQVFTADMWKNNTIWHYSGEKKQHAKKWINKRVFDCSSFVSYGLRELGYVAPGWREVVNGFPRHTDILRYVKREEVRAGDICLRIVKGGEGGGGDHVVVAIDNEKCVEAKGVAYGVVIGDIGKTKYSSFMRVKEGLVPKYPSTYKSKYTAQGPAPLPKKEGGTGSAARSRTEGGTITSSPASRARTPTGEASASDYTSAEQIAPFLKGKVAGWEDKFMEYGDKWGVNPAFMVAIVAQETTWGTSDAIMNFNNPAGIMDWDNNWDTLRRFSTLDAGIEFSFKNLSGYFKRGKTGVQEIANEYAPPNAPNDPGRLNRHWVKNVSSIYKQITGSSEIVTQIGTPPDTTQLSGGNDSGSSNGNTQQESKLTYQKGPNAGVVFGNGVAEPDIDKLGLPLYKYSPLNYLLEESTSKFFGAMGSIWDNVKLWGETDFADANDAFVPGALESYNTMFVDMCRYNHRGRVSRMFPSFVFLIADDAGDWLDGRKLWSNYYIYKSVIDIAIHQSREFPQHTAELTVTNVHHNLDTTLDAQNSYNAMVNSMSATSQWFYKHFGIQFGSPKLTDEMLDIKNTLYPHMDLKPGARIHIRLGTGSDATTYPISFNGNISDVSLGDGVLSMVAISTGHELINNVITADQDEANGVLNMGSEPSDVVCSILTKRSSTFLNTFSSKWGESSAFGIESFGIPRGQEFLEVHKEYDILKNIYMSKYKPNLVCQDKTFFNIDGEANANFYLYNKTPWDAFQYFAQTLPEFVAQASYHNFRCQMFFGLPFWMAKEKYHITAGEVWETAKTFAQFHYIDSLTDIIDNQIEVMGGNTTNCIGTYTLGSGTESSPTVYSDRTILNQYQKTKVIDTTLEQDYFGPDWIYEHTIADVGKQAAIKMCVSNLIDSWNKAYSGEVIIIGDSAIKPCDYLYINDNFAQINGLCTVREVVHRLSVEGGFTTSITPDMIAMSKMKNSGQGNIIKSLMSFGGSLAAVKSGRSVSIQAAADMGAFTCMMRMLKNIDNNDLRPILGSLGNIKLGKNIMAAVKTGEAYLKFAEFANKVYSASDGVMNIVKSFKLYDTAVDGVTGAMKSIKAVRGMKTVFNVAKGVKGGLMAAGTMVFPVVGTAIAWLVGTVAIDWMLGAIVDEFAYNQSIGVFPLTYRGELFICNVTGATQLIPGNSRDRDKESASLEMIDDALKSDMDREAQANGGIYQDQSQHTENPMGPNASSTVRPI